MQYMLCQSDGDNEDLVLHPRMYFYKHLLNVIEERVTVHDGDFVDIQQRMQICTNDNLRFEKVIYHRSRYANTTNRSHIQRTRDYYTHNKTIKGYFDHTNSI